MKKPGYELFKFSPFRHDFLTPLAKLFGTEQLDQLYEEHDHLFQVGDDSKTSFHTKFYDRYRKGWFAMEFLYSRFIIEVVAPMIPEDFLFQKFPTFRVHLYGNVAVGAFHTDSEFNHPEGEINFIIPLTNSGGTACPWVESEPGKGDYTPIPLELGKLVRFNGNKLSHGNKVNGTQLTRLSMDFRILPISFYKEGAGGESLTRGTKFVEGEYYKRFVRSELPT